MAALKWVDIHQQWNLGRTLPNSEYMLSAPNYNLIIAIPIYTSSSQIL